MRSFKCVWFAVILSVWFLAGCSVGPDYVKPQVSTPPAFKESRFTDANSHQWKKAVPSDAVAKGDWWKVFGDEKLDQLEREAEANNPNLRAAMDRVSESRATARATQAEFFPSLNFDPSATRTRISPNGPISVFLPSAATATGLANRSLTGVKVPPIPGEVAKTFNDFRVPFDISYELDIWGKVRRSFESAKAQAQANAAEYETVLLTLKADVALDYFNLRSLDEQRRILRETVTLRRQRYDLYDRRYKAGLENDVTVVQAETELHTAEQQALALDQARAKVEHALAILLGRAPSEFSLPEVSYTFKPPQIPTALPSEVLERRPDVAAAERNMVSANAQIGVAEAAFFPSVRLTGEGGYESVSTSTLFNWESRIWSLGPSVNLPIFEGGRNVANLKKAQSVYDEALNGYRQQTLVAFQQVEDSLADVHYLARQTAVEQQAVDSAKKSDELVRRRFDSGVVNYLEVVDADRIALSTQLILAQLNGQRDASAVQLIKAIGGGWQDSVLRGLR